MRRSLPCFAVSLALLLGALGESEDLVRMSSAGVVPNPSVT